jgi:hypothetical protein
MPTHRSLRPNDHDNSSANHQVIERNGRKWIAAKVRWEEGEEADFRFWYDGLTPEQRVAAVAEALADCLKTRGLDGVPRFRRVHRRIKCPWN